MDEDGSEARDGVWAHPDRVPTSAQLANPDTFFEDLPTDPELSDLDEQLSALLSGTLGFDESVPEEMRGSTEACLMSLK